MTLSVRLYAAARDAAGTAECQVAAGDLDGAAAELAARYGPRFAEVLAASSLLLDGRRIEPPADLPDGSVLEVLPPFAGG